MVKGSSFPLLLSSYFHNRLIFTSPSGLMSGTGKILIPTWLKPLDIRGLQPSYAIAVRTLELFHLSSRLASPHGDYSRPQRASLSPSQQRTLPSFHQEKRTIPSVHSLNFHSFLLLINASISELTLTSFPQVLEGDRWPDSSRLRLPSACGLDAIPFSFLWDLSHHCFSLEFSTVPLPVTTSEFMPLAEAITGKGLGLLIAVRPI